jgi:hypothetical protein
VSINPLRVNQLGDIYLLLEWEIGKKEVNGVGFVRRYRTNPTQKSLTRAQAERSLKAWMISAIPPITPNTAAVHSMASPIPGVV